MKTQCLNISQALPQIKNLKILLPVKFIITGITSLKWYKLLLTLKFSSGQIGSYLLPLLKQLFRDNFMGSEMEMGILLLFVKSYLLIAIHSIRHNTISDRFKKLSVSITKGADREDGHIYQHKQAA